MPLFKSHERAPSAQITRYRRAERSTDELIGICRGVLCDGHVSQQEATFVLNWIERQAEFANTHPFDVLLDHLHHALSHGVMNSDDERDLLNTLSRFVGGEASGELGSDSASLSTTLPLDEPAPAPLVWASTFVVTGTFKFGPRIAVTHAIEDMGGKVASSVSKKIRYLVVGEIGSRDWLHSTYGTKIQHAVELRSQGAQIAILGEAHWAGMLAPK